MGYESQTTLICMISVKIMITIILKIFLIDQNQKLNLLKIYF